MRTFHIGGAASYRTEATTLEARNAGNVKFQNVQTVKSKKGDLIVMNRQGAHLMVDDGNEINVAKVVEGPHQRVLVIGRRRLGRREKHLVKERQDAGSVPCCWASQSCLMRMTGLRV